MYALLDLLVIPILFFLLLLYFFHINRTLLGTPEEARMASPNRWSEKEMREAYNRVREHPVEVTKHLPEKQERRYIVVGGSGLVGGQIVLQLLASGHAPENIRVIDFCKPNRQDMLSGPASMIPFVQCDISSATSTDTAFSKPWPPSVSALPLTVFHTAATIRPGERSKLTYNRSSTVNVTGTQNVLAAARQVGADIFLATSSAGISFRPVQFWISPWTRWPDGYCQFYDESDFNQPLRPHEEYFSNYAASKAEAERLVCNANSDKFRTGCIRPANGIYGSPQDLLIGAALRDGRSITCFRNRIQNLVSAQNVSLAHLLFESVLLTTPFNSAPGGRTFNISDPNPPIAFIDMYNAVAMLAVTPFRLKRMPPVLLLLLSYLVEAYCLLVIRFPFLQAIFREPTGLIRNLQPPILSATTHLIASDAAARLPVERGGLGYVSVCTTLEGMCEQIMKWNAEHAKKEVVDNKTSPV